MLTLYVGFSFIFRVKVVENLRNEYERFVPRFVYVDLQKISRGDTANKTKIFKNMKKLLLALALMLPMVVFTACEKEEDKLIGTWVPSSGDFVDFVAYVQFNEDHTGCFGYTFTLEDGVDYDSFTWSATENHLTIDWGGDVEEYTYSIDGNNLTLTYIEDNEITIFHRK